MGSEISIQKTRSHYLEDSFKHSIMNNLSPVGFHEVHGENIRLSNNGTIACRAEGFCKGITFSNRPIKVNEHIYVKFVEISSSWSGALRIGFTSNNPVTFRSSLPRYACPDLTNKPGNWAKALAERLAKENSVLFYYFDESGEVHYGIDNENIGVFFSGVNTSSPLWALLDVYGNTRTVELLAPRSVRSEDPNAVVNVERIVSPHHPGVQLKSSEVFTGFNLKPLPFHQTHGRNVSLSRNSYGAKRKNSTDGMGYLFTARPLCTEEKIILQIVSTDPNARQSLIFGVTSCDPGIISDDLPENCDDFLDRSEYWALWRDSSNYNMGDIFVCNITSKGEFQFSRNGDPLSTVVYVDNTLPLWFFMDLCGAIHEINLIGSTNVLPDFKFLKKEMKELLPIFQTNKLIGLEHGDTFLGSEDCVICYEKPVDCVLYRCGHMCLCYKCGKEILKSGAQCPICRTTVQDAIKTYR